ncbi:hypothetical protein NBRC3257_3308 [Gluconobacter thailandicus NBRC 3257]|uniref:Transposase n=1 Tax=Gluconobacter thailandicus NBRC 3257 TaxID=1381097 RepID=A0ABQ0J1J1_GLUTH|nr:hypothetical protein NBRC3257_3308 [Gluconobacter thailandicus NBRC 3257]
MKTAHATQSSKTIQIKWFSQMCFHMIKNSRLRTHSQKMTVAARQMAEKKTVGHLS